MKMETISRGLFLLITYHKTGKPEKHMTPEFKSTDLIYIYIYIVSFQSEITDHVKIKDKQKKKEIFNTHKTEYIILKFMLILIWSRFLIETYI